ncbi:MAG: Nucleolar Complex 2 protein [Chaenotheca gracillima]|nr:MAG: Nucleolar Complex 2 protein [Chaenotheca gracillima]
MTNKSKKTTRKFESKHLKDEIGRRKEFAKIKQRHQQKDKKRAKKAREEPEPDESHDGANGTTASPQAKKSDKFGDMSVEDFFQGGFAIPEQPEGKKRKRNKATELPKKRSKHQEEIAGSGSDDGSSDSLENGLGLDDESLGSDEEEDPGMSKAEMDALAEKDPEFYKFLQENDAELLDFDEDGELAGGAGLSDSDQEVDQPKKKTKKAKKQKKEEKEEEEVVEDDEESDEEIAGVGTEVTMDLIKKWEKAMTDMQSLRASREAVLAFRAAAHVNEDDGRSYKYSIGNPDVYHGLLVLTLTNVPKVLQHHLPIKESAAGKLRIPTESKKFRTLSPLLKSHALALDHLLTGLSDAATLKLTLSSIVPLLPYFLSFKKLLRNLVKTVVGIWSDSSNTEATRVTAFLVLRRLAVIGDSGLREVVLKTAYQGLVRGSQHTTVHTIQGVNLMKNSAAELWGLDQTVGYTTGFSFIRQLAIHLRGSITNPTKESYKTVYNWQFVHSLDFWSRVLSTHCDSLKEAEAGKDSALRPLIYPAVQIALGAMRLIPTAQYFPLRFQLVRSLLRISLSTGTYIPLAPALLEVLNSAEMKKAPKPTTLKSLDFSIVIRAPKTLLRTRIYQDGVGEQIAELLTEFFVLWTRNIAFPELSLPVLVMLKRWLKEVSNKQTGNKNGKVNSAIGLAVQKLEANSKWVEERRAKVEFAPNNRAGVEGFLKEVDWTKTPLGAFVSGQRKQRLEKAKILEEGRREEERKRRGNKDADSDEVMLENGDGDGDSDMSE